MKTAIEELIDEIKMIQKGSVNKKESKSLKSLNGIIRLAEKKLPIEKQQIVDAVANQLSGVMFEDSAKQVGEEYYKTTFNK